MSAFKKITAFLAAVSITATMAGCGKNTTTALEVDGYQVPAGVYIYFANTAYNQALSQLKDEDPELDTTDTKAVKAAMLEGQDVLSWVQDKATEMCVDFVAAEKKFDELGLELKADEKMYLDSMIEYYWESSKDSMISNGVSEDSFRKIMTSSYKSDAIFEYYYGVDGELGVTEEELRIYYMEHNMRTQYVAFDLVDGEGNMLKSEGKAEMKTLVEGYQKRVQDAYDEGGVEAVMTEMNYVKEDYDYYVTSVSEEAADVPEEERTTTTAREAASTTTAAEEEAETTAEAAEEEAASEASEAAETEAASEASETAEIEDETLNPLARTAEGEEESEETTEAEEAEETEAEETAAEETAEEQTETTAAAEENGEETETETAAPEEELDLETLTETVSYVNESVIRILNLDDYEDEDTIPYTPSEKTYNTLLGIQEADYGKPYFVEEDEKYYLAVRYDIRDRMTEDDLWTESTMNSTNYTMHNEDYEALMDTWTDVMDVKRNDAAYRRYDPFKFEF